MEEPELHRPTFQATTGLRTAMALLRVTVQTDNIGELLPTKLQATKAI